MPVLEVGNDVSVFRYQKAGKPEKRDHLIFCLLFHSGFSVTKSAGKRIKQEGAHAFLFV